MGNQKLREIVEVLRSRPWGLNAEKISSLTKMNYNTCRTYCNRLCDLGVLIKPTRGFFRLNPKYGVGELVVPRVHNVRVRFFVGGKIESDRVFKEVGNVKFDVSFGSKRGKVYGIISCGEGLDYTGFCLAIDYFKRILKLKLGSKVSDDSIEVDSIELNEDYSKLKIEKRGEVLTVQSVKGSLERIYNKAGGLRSEVKVKPDSLHSIYALLKGGVSSYNILQGIFLQNQRIEELTEALKFQNALQGQNNRLLQAIFDRGLRTLQENHSRPEDTGYCKPSKTDDEEVIIRKKGSLKDVEI